MNGVEGGVFNHEWMGIDTKMGRKGATPRRFAPPLSRGDLWGGGGGLGLVERKGDEWTAAALRASQ
jgi:hypothetical protein